MIKLDFFACVFKISVILRTGNFKNVHSNFETAASRTWQNHKHLRFMSSDRMDLAVTFPDE